MANELKHTSVGTELTQVEFEAVGLHVLDSQATGDIIYASSATQLSRLALGTTGYFLKAGATLPEWAPAMPSGCIIMWAGTIANIPTGFVICDGNNGTPNLLGRFVEGVATAATNPGTTGGSTSKTTAGHTHTLSGSSNIPNDGGNALSSATDSIADIRPLYYDLAFIMKT
jgi:hypothetical protein